MITRVAAMATLMCLIGCTTTDGTPQIDSAPQLPEQALLSSPMRAQPGPGWTVTVDELELAPGTAIRPVGSVGDRGIFLGISGGGWSLLGIDVTDGRRLFGPIQLGSSDGAEGFDCFINGPPMVLCVRQSVDAGAPSTAWTIDTSSGAVMFDGPTDVRVFSPDQPVLEQVGDYAVAAVANKGVHGVGPRGELTWFAPGNGILATQFTRPGYDFSPPTLAIQGGAAGDVVFSLRDGEIVKPALPQDARLGKAVVYPGGFGYEYAPADDLTRERVAFFDDGGSKLSEPTLDGTLDIGSPDLPTVRTTSKRLVLTLDGRTLLELPLSLPAVEGRLIGSNFYLAADGEGHLWQRFDLETGAAGKTCDGDALGYQYVGSDGEVAVAHGDGLARGVDLATCETLWSLAGSTPTEIKEVWKVHTTLVQRAGDRLFSLVAPS